MKTTLSAIFVCVFVAHVGHAETSIEFNELDKKLCTAVSKTFDGIDAEILTNCIYEAQRIRNTHQCSDSSDTLTCLYTSCDIEPPVKKYTTEQMTCLTQHLSAEDAALISAVAEFVTSLVQQN